MFIQTFSRVDIEFGESLNYSSYPNLSIKLKALKDGQPREFALSNVVIMEGNYPISPSFVSKPDFNGYQTISWTSTSPEFSKPEFYITVENEVGNATPSNIVQHPIYEKPASYLKFIDNDRNLLREIRFGSVQVGEYTNQRINVASAIQKSTGSIYYPTRADWISTTSEEFKYLWLGSTYNTNPPPVDIISPFPYAIEVLYIPNNNNYKREYLTVSYDNGRKSYIAMVANSFSIAKRTQLQLNKPKVDEILYPCQRYQIKWNGNNPNVPVQVDFTVDKGKNWEEIGTTLNQDIIWSVPNVDTDSLFIRLSQGFSPPSEKTISLKANRPQKIAFNSNGNKIISATKDGRVTEIDSKTKLELKSFPFASIDYPFEQSNIIKLSYFGGDTFAVVLYRWADFYGYEKADTLVVLNLLEQRILGKLNFNAQEKVKTFQIDEKNKKLIIVKDKQNVLEIYNLPDLTIQTQVALNGPIQEIALKNNVIAVALLSNKIQLYNIDNFSLIKEIEIKYQPIITNLSISNDGAFIAYTTKKHNIQDVIENLSDAYIIDIKSGQIVRSLYNNWSEAIGAEFSPTDNYLVLGFENNPSLVIWDLVNDVRVSEIYGSGFNITDFKVSNESFTIATAEPSRNLITFRDFNFPETVISGPFKIHKPKILAKEVMLPPQKIYYQTTSEFDKNFCNIGDVPLIINHAYFVFGRNFSINGNFNNDTVQIGTCYPLKISYNPRDTGNFVDTLIIISCGERYFIPFRGKGINRDFKFLVQEIDFGQVCINETKEIELDLGFNNDTFQLPIDFVRINPNEQAYFTVTEGNGYQVLSPSQRLRTKIKFHPKQLGNVSSFLEIFYLGQQEYIFRIPIRGEGIGVNINLSTTDLRFIPEIPTRDITIKNLSNTDIMVDSVVLNPVNYFAVNVAFPFLLPANSAKILSITMLEPPPIDVKMTIFSSPCSAIQSLTLGQYFGNSVIQLPIVETEPKGMIELGLSYQNVENKPYNGKRFFDAEITLNATMFLPLFVESEFGTATLTKNLIIDNRRIIGIRVEGNFPSEGIFAKIKGNVGLSDFDTTKIEFNTESHFWGKNVKVDYQNGLIRLIGLCGSRRIIVDNAPIKNAKINPQPASESFELTFTSEKNGFILITIFDILGNLVYSESFYTDRGIIMKNINVSELTNGLYKLTISLEDYSHFIEFLKINF